MMRHRFMICAAAVLLLPGLVRAESLSFTEQFVANFDFQLLGGTVINPGPATPFIPFEAIGSLTFVLDPSLNDPTKTTVPFTSVTGTLTGVLPAGFLPYTISPDLQFLGGELTNIVRDSSGNVISADVSDLSMRWDLVSPALTLYTQVGLPFDGAITSLPFAVGTVLSGLDPFDVYLQGGPDTPVAVGENRILTVSSVPEPTSLALAGVAALLVGAVITRRRWS